MVVLVTTVLCSMAPPEWEKEVNMLRVKIKIEGSSPMLQNAMTEDTLQGLWTPDKKAKTAGRPLPRDHANSRVYKDDKGRPYIPGVNLMACLIAAGVFLRADGKRQFSTAKSSILPGLITLEESAILLFDRDGEQAKWEVDMRRGVNPNGNEAVAVVRPRFDSWTMTFHLLINEDQVPESKIRDLVDIAGRSIGLGDFRPARKGTFGRFKVVAWKRVADETSQAAE